MPVATIAALTFRELLRRRVLAVGAILTAVAIVASCWGLWSIESRLANSGHAGDPAAKVTFSLVVTLLAWAFSFVLAIVAAFLGASSLASDIDSGLLLAIVPRPLSRSEFALGRWTGLASMIVLYTALCAGIELGFVALVAGYVPPQPVAAVAEMIWEALAVLTLAMLFSTRLPTIAGAIGAVAAVGIAWVAGIIGSIASSINQEGLYHATTVVKLLIPTDGISRAAQAALQPVALAAVTSATVNGHPANPLGSEGPPSPAFLIWAAAWTAGMLALSLFAFVRRDL